MLSLEMQVNGAEKYDLCLPSLARKMPLYLELVGQTIGIHTTVTSRLLQYTLHRSHLNVSLVTSVGAECHSLVIRDGHRQENQISS